MMHIPASKRFVVLKFDLIYDSLRKVEKKKDQIPLILLSKLFLSKIFKKIKSF